MTKYLHSIFPLMLFSIYRFRFCLRYTHKAMYIIATKSNIYAVHSLCCFSLFRKTNRNLFYRIQIERNSINVRRTCLHTLSGASEECLNQFLYHNIWFILFLLFFSVVNTYAMPENTFPTIYVVIVVVVFDYFITNLNKYTYFFCRSSVFTSTCLSTCVSMRFAFGDWLLHYFGKHTRSPRKKMRNFAVNDKDTVDTWNCATSISIDWMSVQHKDRWKLNVQYMVENNQQRHNGDSAIVCVCVASDIYSREETINS